MDSVSQHLSSAQIRNFERWNILDNYIWPNYQLAESYEDEIGFLKILIYHRANWIDENISDIRLIFPDCSSEEKKLLNTVNILGEKSEYRNNKILFNIYDNGCVEKTISLTNTNQLFKLIARPGYNLKSD